MNCIFSWIRKAGLQFEGGFAKVWATQKTWIHNTVKLKVLYAQFTLL